MKPPTPLWKLLPPYFPSIPGSKCTCNLSGFCGIPYGWKNVNHGPRPLGVWRPPPPPPSLHPFDSPRDDTLGSFDEIDEVSLYSWHSSCPEHSDHGSPEPSEAALQAQQLAALIGDFASDSDDCSDIIDPDTTFGSASTSARDTNCRTFAFDATRPFVGH